MYCNIDISMAIARVVFVVISVLWILLLILRASDSQFIFLLFWKKLRLQLLLTYLFGFIFRILILWFVKFMC